MAGIPLGSRGGVPPSPTLGGPTGLPGQMRPHPHMQYGAYGGDIPSHAHAPMLAGGGGGLYGPPMSSHGPYPPLGGHAGAVPQFQGPPAMRHPPPPGMQPGPTAALRSPVVGGGGVGGLVSSNGMGAHAMQAPMGAYAAPNGPVAMRGAETVREPSMLFPGMALPSIGAVNARLGSGMVQMGGASGAVGAHGAPLQGHAVVQVPQHPAVQAQAYPSQHRPPGRVETQGPCCLRLLQLNENISRHPDNNTIEWWGWFVEEFFAENAVIRYSHFNTQYRENRLFELTTALLARFYKTHFDSGVCQISYAMENPREYNLPGNAYLVVDCLRACMAHTFASGTQVHFDGHLRVIFGPQLKITYWEFAAQPHREYIPRDILVRDTQPDADGTVAARVPPSQVNEYGLTMKTMRCLEMAEVVGQMGELMAFSLQQRDKGAFFALHELCSVFGLDAGGPAAQTQQPAQSQQSQHLLPDHDDSPESPIPDDPPTRARGRGRSRPPPSADGGAPVPKRRRTADSDSPPANDSVSRDGARKTQRAQANAAAAAARAQVEENGPRPPRAKGTRNSADSSSTSNTSVEDDADGLAVGIVPGAAPTDPAVAAALQAAAKHLRGARRGGTLMRAVAPPSAFDAGGPGLEDAPEAVDAAMDVAAGTVTGAKGPFENAAASVVGDDSYGTSTGSPQEDSHTFTLETSSDAPSGDTMAARAAPGALFITDPDVAAALAAANVAHTTGEAMPAATGALGKGEEAVGPDVAANEVAVAVLADGGNVEGGGDEGDVIENPFDRLPPERDEMPPEAPAIQADADAVV